MEAFAANTHSGVLKDLNEDRVSIVTNLLPPKERKHQFYIKGTKNQNDQQAEELARKCLKRWPRCSFFGVYDGHNGSGCAEFLRDNLHKYITGEESFPGDPEQAISDGFKALEQAFLS